jgi:hypothetical protein
MLMNGSYQMHRTMYALWHDDVNVSDRGLVMPHVIFSASSSFI